MTENKKRGLSLVEITLSMAILIIVMLPTFMTFSSGSRGIQMTDAEFRAHSAAIELMEQTMSLPFDMLFSQNAMDLSPSFLLKLVIQLF